MTSKTHLLRELNRRVAADLAALIRQQQAVQDSATHAESRAEHAKDTRATEQSYLARGLAQRVEETQRTLAALATVENRNFGPGDPIALMALVDLCEVGTSETQSWWLVPGAGGIELVDGSRTIRTLTPGAPLGRALLGLRIGEAALLARAEGERAFEILGLA